MKIITLVDGNSLMFRSFYATSYAGKLMQNSKGLYTNAIFGFVNMFTKIITDEDVDYIFVAFDAGKQTFRHQEFDGYKGTRKQLPDELRVQIPYIKEYLDILNIKRYETLDFEADDLIATIAEKSYNDFDEIRIITGDKDLLQLVNDKIKVFLTRKGVVELEEFNEENFFNKNNITPLQVTDYKGLVGDTSDNLPGIKGIGQITAIKLLEQYHSLEGIYENVEELKGKTKTLFIENEDIAKKCKYLATLRKDANIDLELEEFELCEANLNKLIDFLKEMEFHSILKKLDFSKEVEKKDIHVKIIEDVNFDFHNILVSDSYVTIEVFGKNYYTGDLLGLGILIDNTNYFVTNEVIKNNQILKEYLENDNYKKKTFDYKMLYVVLKRFNIDIKNVDFDLLIGAYLINPAYASDDIKIVVENFKNSDLDFYDTIYGANTKMAVPNINVYSSYSLRKCTVIKELEIEILKQLKEMELDYLFKIEMKLSRVLGKMELDGLYIDLPKLKEIGKDLEKKANEIAEEIFQEAQAEFNLNSPKQLGEILFEKLKLPHGKRNKTGFSTNVDVLEKLAVDHKIARNILDYRTYNKLITTYVNGIQEVTNIDSFIHPLYKQALTLTGRLSSIEPNIQNMPIRTEAGQVIREIFKSRFENGSILAADYSQIELRILAHMSKDDNMIQAFNSNVDFHAMTAARIYEIDINDVTKENRRTAKAINFGIIYGMSAWGLSETIGISPLEANIYINKYFDTYKLAKDFLDKTIETTRNEGYTKTIFNRRRYIPEINNKNNNLRSFGERTAMNAPIQGSAADIIKVAMISVFEKMNCLGLRSLLIAQVHDELVFDCPKDEVLIMEKLIKEEMENVLKLEVKLIAEVNHGNSWFEAK